jgi:hypothetical protein
MKNESVRFPVCLRWQSIRFSPWLLLYFLLVGVCPFLSAVLLEWRRRGGPLGQAYFAWVANYQSAAAAVILYWLAGVGFLVWFTYFSKNARVKDHDKFAVFMMLCGAVGGWIVTAIRLLFGR